MRDWIKALPLGFGLPLVIGAASVKPEDAASNLLAWGRWLGVHDLPSWISDPRIYHGTIFGAVVLGAIYAVLVWPIPAISRLAKLRSGALRRPTPANHGKPELRLTMRGGNVFVADLPEMKGRLTGIAIDADVWNTGAPSAATEWSLTIKPQRKAAVPAQFTAIPGRLKAKGKAGKAVIRAIDALDSKTKNSPISSMPISGKLLFYVQLDQATVLSPTTQLKLSVKDIYGTETGTTKTIGDWLQRGG